MLLDLPMRLAWRRHRYCHECRAQRWRREQLDCGSLRLRTKTTWRLPLLRGRRATRQQQREEGLKDVRTCVDCTMIAYTCGVLWLKRSRSSRYGQPGMPWVLLYSILFSYLFIPSRSSHITRPGYHMPPSTSPSASSSTLRQPTHSRSARPDRATSAPVLLKEFDTAQLLNDPLCTGNTTTNLQYSALVTAHWICNTACNHKYQGVLQYLAAHI